MFEDCEDPYSRLERLEAALYQTMKHSELQAEQLHSQAELLSNMSRHLRDLSQAFTEVFDRIIKLERR